MTNPKKLIFITGNMNKLREAKHILSNFEIENKKIDLPEYQGDAHYIAKEKAKLASETLECSVFIDDTNLRFNALNGLPGPYIKDFLEKLGRNGLVKMLGSYEDKRAEAVALIAYCEYGGEPIVFEGITEGTIVEPRGDSNFGWDPIFRPRGHDITYAEMDAETKNNISHRYKALMAFNEFLKKDN